MPELIHLVVLVQLVQVVDGHDAFAVGDQEGKLAILGGGT